MLNFFLNSVKNFFNAFSAVFEFSSNKKKKSIENLKIAEHQGKLKFLKEDNTEKYLCNACGICKSICPSKEALDITNEDGKICVKYDFSKCIFCGNCIENCPVKAISFSNENKPLTQNQTIEVIEWK